ncbi:deaminase domain-containing protein [Nocardia sp. NPDC006630]|uniref:WXG100-like domain-containing protein n=1 Tax=Nocardia sp. NPDC006630 TaxID=3157181 RepID=UPI0033BBE4DF
MGWTTAVGDFFPSWLMTGLNFGMAYPKGDQDELFALGDAWKHAAAELEKLEPTLRGVTDQVPQYYVGDGATAATAAFATLFAGDHSIPNLIEGLQGLGHDARSTATEIEFAKIQSEIFAVMTLWTVVSLMSSLVGSAAVPAYLLAARAVLAKFAAEVADRIGAIMAESGLKTLAAPLVREVIVPLGERIAPLAEKLTTAGEKLTAAGDKWTALNQTIAKSGPIVRYPVAALKGGLHGGLMGAGMDAGTQVVQIMEGHRDDGFNLKQTFQTSLQWGAGGVLGGPTGEFAGRSLANRALQNPSKELPKWLGGTIAGGASGAAGAAGMYGAGLGTQLYDNKGDWSKVKTSFSPQLLIGGLAMGTMGGGHGGLAEQARIDSPANIESGTKQAPVEASAITKADGPQALDVQQKPFGEHLAHTQAGDAAPESGGPRSNSHGQENFSNNSPANAPEHRGSQTNSDTRNGAGDTNRPNAETAKPADAAAKPSDNGARPAAVNDRPGEAPTPKDGGAARPAADSSARVANVAPADQKANFVASAQDKPAQAPIARAPEVRAPEVQTAAPRPETLQTRPETAAQPPATRTNDVAPGLSDASPAPEAVRPDQRTDGAMSQGPAPGDNALRTDVSPDQEANRPGTTTTKPEANTRAPEKVSKDSATDDSRRDGDPASDQPVAPLPYVEPTEGPRDTPTRNTENPRIRRDLAAKRPDDRSSEYPQKSDSHSPQSEIHPVEAHPVEGDWSPRLDDHWSRMNAHEISDELARRWGIQTEGFDNPKLHPEVAREFARAVDDMLSRYPDVKLPKITIDKLSDDYNAATHWDVSPGGQMYTEAVILNETPALNPEEMARDSAELEANGHFVPGSGDRPIHSALVHEFGHTIAIEGQGHASETASEALERYYRSTRDGMDRPAYGKWLDQLSDYSFYEDGQLHPDEALAEAFADVEINGEAASEPAKVLYWHLLDSAGEHSVAPNGFTHVPENTIARPNGPHTPESEQQPSQLNPDAAPRPAQLTPELREGFEGLRQQATEIVHAQGDPARAADLANLQHEYARQFDELSLRSPEADSWKLFFEHDPALAQYFADHANELLPPPEESSAHVEIHAPAETETPRPDEAGPESSATSHDKFESPANPDRPSTLTPHLKDRFEQIRERINNIFSAYHDPARAPELPGLRAEFGDLVDRVGLHDPEAGTIAEQLFNDHDATLAQYFAQNREHLLPQPGDIAEAHFEPHTEPSDHDLIEHSQNEHPTDEPHADSPDQQSHNNIPELEAIAELTPDEQDALHRYTDPDANVFSDLNDRLRNERDLDPEQQKLAADMAAGLEKLPAYDGTVWRGTHLTPEQIARYVPGAKVPESSFTSTSRDPRRIFSSNVEFIVHSETGRDISAISARPGEKEVLFKPGTTFEVRGVVEDPRAGLFGVTRVYLYESSEHTPIHEIPSDHAGHEALQSDHSTNHVDDNHPSEELPVRHGPDRTALGDSPEVQRVYDNVRNEGEHDVVVHGDRFGKPTTDGNFEIDPQQVVDAIRNNPNYVEGTPVRLLSCHSGNDIGWAQHIANELGVPVRAPSDLVGVRALPDSPATLHNAAEWRTSQPAEADGATPQPVVHKPIDQTDGRLPKYEEDPRENWDILSNEKAGDETAPPADRTAEDRPAGEPTEPAPDTPATSEVPKPRVPEEESVSDRSAPSEDRTARPRDKTDESQPDQGPHRDLPADRQPARDTEQQPSTAEAPIRKEQPRATGDHENARAPEREQPPNDTRPETPNKPGSDTQDPETAPAAPRDELPKHVDDANSDPAAAHHQTAEDTRTKHDDEVIPRPVTEDELLNQRGMPLANQRAFQRLCEEFNYVMDVRPTTPSAVRWLEEGAMPKPKPIKAKSINEFDVYLGAPEDKIGLVGSFEPEKPVRTDVPPELWEKVSSRYDERLNEWNRDREKMERFLERKEFYVEDKVVYGYDKDTGKPRPLTGDHDLFDIRKPNGDRLSLEEVTAVTNRMIDENMGVMHGPHRYWPEMDPPVDQGIYQKIVDGHGPGGEPLIRFSPDAGPILVDSSTPVPYIADSPAHPQTEAPAERPLSPDAEQAPKPATEQHQEPIQPHTDEAPTVDSTTHSATEVEHSDPGKETEAGVSFHPEDEVLSNLADQVPKDPNHFTADVHIDENGNARIGDRTYTPEEFGDLLRRNGWDGKTPVRLIGCDAATNGFAGRLAAHLDTDVLAPTKPAWSDTHGRLYTSTAERNPDGTRRPRIPPDGQWETHHPNGTKSTATEDGFAPGTRDEHKHDINPKDAHERHTEETTDPTPHDGENTTPEPSIRQVAVDDPEIRHLVEMHSRARQATRVGWKTMGGALEYNIAGESGAFAGFSGQRDVAGNAPSDADVPPIATPVQDNQIVPGDLPSERFRPNDAENNMLEHLIRTVLQDYPLDSKGVSSASGRILLFSEQSPCDSCDSVIKRFGRMYPGIEIEVAYVAPYPPVLRDRPTLRPLHEEP